MEDIWYDLVQFIDKIVEILLMVVETTDKTADLLNGIEFQENAFTHYLGYARYVMGAPLWYLFTTVLLIPIGVTIWVYALKGIGYIKNLNFWS